MTQDVAQAMDDTFTRMDNQLMALTSDNAAIVDTLGQFDETMEKVMQLANIAVGLSAGAVFVAVLAFVMGLVM